MLLDSLSMKLDIEEIKKRLENQDKDLELVFTYLDELLLFFFEPQAKHSRSHTHSILALTLTLFRYFHTSSH